MLGVSGGSARRRDEPSLPWSAPRTGETLEETARRLVRAHVGIEASWLEQVGAFGDGSRHASGASLSVCFVAVVTGAAADRVRDPAVWLDADGVTQLPPREREMVAAAQATARQRMDYAPVPFRLLPPLFTLSELQEMYELLLGRRLHKASFRRALHAAWLVEPTDQWRSEGRGRPAQLFRYAPRKRRSHRRGVRFDLL